MFIWRLLTATLALPFCWLGKIAAASSLSVAARLFLKAAWFISGRGEYARLAISVVNQYEGYDAALAFAEKWIPRRPRPELAAAAGLLAISHGQYDKAAAMLNVAKAAKPDPLGQVELLEFLVSQRKGDSEEAMRIRHDLETRNDLSPELTRILITDRIWDSMLHGRFEEAWKQSNKVLDIEDFAPAWIAQWALARRDGDATKAQKCLARCKAIKPELKLLYMTAGAASIGESAEAAQFLSQLRERSEPDAKWVEGKLKLAGVAI